MTEMVIYIVAGATLLFFVWKEYTRKNRGRLVWRVLATIMAVAALACMGLPMRFKKNVEPVSKEVVLLTEGFISDSVQAFLRSNRMPVYTFDETLLAAEKFDAKLLVYPGDIAGFRPHIFGYGLNKDQLAQLPPYIFHPSPATGITAVHWRRKIKTGEQLAVQGNYKNTSSTPVKIVLSNFQTGFDSVTVAAGKEQFFTLAASPKQLGRVLYHIAVTGKNDTLQKEPVPVEIEQGEPVCVLMLASSPDFDNRFLKNWLSEKGYPVVVRTAISKNRFSRDYLNIAETNIGRITSSLLEKFDIILADASELAVIGKDELSAIQSFVTQKKAGLIIRSDSAATGHSFYSGFFPLSHADSGRQSVQLSLQDISHSLPAIAIDHLQFIREQPDTKPLIRDKQSRVFAALALYGAGKIVMTSIPNSFSWALSGNKEAYNEVWSEIFNAAYPDKTGKETWQVNPFIPSIHEPAAITLQTQAAGVPQAAIEGATVYMQQNAWLPYQWAATFWPVQQGWQTGIGLNGQPWYWYAFGKQEWQSVKNSRKLSAMSYQPSAVSEQKEDALRQATSDKREDVSKIWFFLMFLIAASFLWFENKYLNR